MELVSCGSGPIAELSTRDGIVEEASSIIEPVLGSLTSGRSGAEVIEFRGSEMVLDGRSLVTAEVEEVSGIASKFVDAEAGISDKASELVVMDGKSVASATSLVGRGSRLTVELSIDIIAEGSSEMMDVIDDDPATSATSLVGRGSMLTAELLTYAIAEGASCMVEVADKGSALFKMSLVGRDP